MMNSSNPVSRPNPINYDFYYHVDDPEYDPDDWDEEIYYDDLQGWRMTDGGDPQLAERKSVL